MIWLPLLMMAIATFQSAAAIPTCEGDEARAVLEANRQFFKALNAIFAGELAPMKSVWAHTDDVIYMGPGGGTQVGWEQVLANWEYQASLNLGGEVNPENIHITMGTDIAIVQNRIKGQNIVNGEPQEISIRATQVFRKKKDGWKVVSVHTDTLSFTGEGDNPIFIFKN